MEVEKLLAEATRAAGGSAGDGGGSIDDQYKVVITCRDEPHQADLLDALDCNDGGRLAELLRGLECRAFVAQGCDQLPSHVSSKEQLAVNVP